MRFVATVTRENFENGDEPLEALTETLDTELKAWLLPENDRQAAILAKAMLALRNNNGGRIVIGIANSDGASVPPPPGLVLGDAYHADVVNGLIGRYALPKFEVRVSIRKYGDVDHPVIAVPGGITSPVISRRGFDGEIRQNAVYVRTISKGRASSCEPVRPEDWDCLLSICFDNREADVGRFLRRHLPQILENVRAGAAPPPLSGTALARQFLELGRTHFQARLNEPA